MTEYEGMLTEYHPMSFEYKFSSAKGCATIYGESTDLMNSLFDAMRNRWKVKIIIEDGVK